MQAVVLFLGRLRVDTRVAFFSLGLIFTRARVLLALLSLRKNGGLLVVYFLGQEVERINVKSSKV